MKSIIIEQFGDSSVFTEINLPIPVVTAGHVLIKVKATSVNPLDFKLRKGVFPDLVPTFPMVLHGDVAGIIEKVGPGVTHFNVGDEVYGCVGGLLNMQGALAEYVLADCNLIALKPRSISFNEAAALPLVALTAWEALVSYTRLQKEQHILIHGGTGGVGHIAIQLAKWLGAKVYATCSSEEKSDIALQLGADVVINYKTTSMTDYIANHTQGGFDIVFDTVGGDNLTQCITAAALFGQVVSISAAGQFDLTPAFLKGLSIHTVMQPLPLITGLKRQHYQNILIKIAELVDTGIIRPIVDKTLFTIQEVGQAHDHLEQGNAIGKVVLTVV